MTLLELYEYVESISDLKELNPLLREHQGVDKHTSKKVEIDRATGVEVTLLSPWGMQMQIYDRLQKSSVAGQISHETLCWHCQIADGDFCLSGLESWADEKRKGEGFTLNAEGVSTEVAFFHLKLYLMTTLKARMSREELWTLRYRRVRVWFGFRK